MSSTTVRFQLCLQTPSRQNTTGHYTSVPLVSWPSSARRTDSLFFRVGRPLSDDTRWRAAAPFVPRAWLVANGLLHLLPVLLAHCCMFVGDVAQRVRPPTAGDCVLLRASAITGRPRGCSSTACTSSSSSSSFSEAWDIFLLAESLPTSRPSLPAPELHCCNLSVMVVDSRLRYRDTSRLHIVSHTKIQKAIENREK